MSLAEADSFCDRAKPRNVSSWILGTPAAHVRRAGETAQQWRSMERRDIGGGEQGQGDGLRSERRDSPRQEAGSRDLPGRALYELNENDRLRARLPAEPPEALALPAKLPVELARLRARLAPLRVQLAGLPAEPAPLRVRPATLRARPARSSVEPAAFPA